MATTQVVVLVSALLGWSDITIQASRGDRGYSAFQRKPRELTGPATGRWRRSGGMTSQRSYRRNA